MQASSSSLSPSLTSPKGINLGINNYTSSLTKETAWDITKKVAAVGIVVLPLFSVPLAITALVLNCAGRVIMDGAKEDQKTSTQQGTKSWTSCLRDVSTLGTTILMITPASISLGIIALGVAACIINYGHDFQECDEKRKVESSPNSASTPGALPPSSSSSNSSSEALAEVTSKTNKRGWAIYAAESFSGYAIIHMIFNVARMSFVSSAQEALLAAVAYGGIAFAAKFIARDIEKADGIDLNELDYDEALFKEIRNSKIIQWVGRVFKDAFSGKRFNASLEIKST